LTSLTLTGRTPDRVGGNALGVVAVFSFGGLFDTEPGPGLFVPALRATFYTAGDCGAKKGGCNNRQEKALLLTRENRAKASCTKFNMRII
jgi:hypothetical protein